MTTQNQGAGIDLFDLYFQRADLDKDGRISGAEAVGFFQGSGLPKQVLAQVWMHADQSRTGFLNRHEFYNALKLVTVAQSKRDLTPDIVKAALYGPAASKIPAPKINIPPAAAGQSSPIPLSPSPQMAPAAPTGLLNPGIRGPIPPNTTINQPYFPSHGNQMIRPPQAILNDSAQHTSQSAPGLPNAAISTDWLSGRANVGTSGPITTIPNRGIAPSSSSPLPGTQNSQSTLSQAIAKDYKPSVSSNGPASSFPVGDDLFSAIVPLPKRDPSPATSFVSSTPTSSALVPVDAVPQSSSIKSSLDSLQTGFSKQSFSVQPPQTQPGGGQAQRTNMTSFNPSHPASLAISSSVSPGTQQGLGNPPSNDAQPPWPKITPAGVQKYSKVFMEVDSDRDGKISGEQARNLFLSWRLPREVLKQVWDLADQDNDSMLSLREFCISLYLMERYREGRPLPASLPNSIMFDETLMRMTGPPNSSYGHAAGGANGGFRQMPGAPGSQQMPQPGSVRPPKPATGPQFNSPREINQQMLPPDQFNSSQMNQRGPGGVNIANQSAQEAIDVDKKKVDKVILDSKEKLDFYRTKMQDLVLYKSRCDNRLNEIIERASADKREAEMVGKKYEEKYKQIAEMASKLTMEEATFREYQERKMELRQAILNMEQGGSADGILQVRADRIQSDLDELAKALSERCKKHGMEIKSAALIELPTGWLPGIQEEAAVWDEDWDKFDDEGLAFDNDLTADAQNVTAAPKSISTSFVDDMYPQDGRLSPDSSLFADGKSEKLSSKGERIQDSESGYSHSEEDSASSPAQRNADFADVFTRSSEADNEFHRSFDDQGWGTFDGNDDVDSVWGYNTNSKDQHRDGGMFDSGSFGLSPVKTNSSSQPESNFNSKGSIFADSVPGTPFSKFANSPRYSEAGDNNLFDNYSRFDSFSMNESAQFSPPRETFSRFDSISSSRGGEAPFTRFDSINSSKGDAMFGKFDSSVSSSRGFNSFDDADPFGSSAPFKASNESHTPRKGSDGWSSF